MSNLPERLRLLRREKNLKQEEIAALTELGLRSYRRYETGEREPTLSALTRLADFFEVSIDYLVGRSEKK